MRAATDAADGESDVDGGADVRIEQIRFEVDLAIGDGDNVRRNIGRHVTGLGFDERERGQRSTALFIGKLRRTFQQAAVKIEHVARERLAAWRTAQQQRNFAVRRGVLRQIVVNAKCVAGIVAEEFAHRATCIRGDVLHRSRIGSGGRDDDRILHCAVVFQSLDDLGDGGTLLADGDVNTNNAIAFLVDNGVERDGSLAGLAIANNQFALATADRDHGVDGLDTGLHGLFHGLAVNHAGGDAFKRQSERGVDGAFTVDRLAEGIDDTADQSLANGHGHDLAGAANRVAFLQTSVVAKQHGTDLVFFEVERDARQAVIELDQLAGHNAFQAVNTGNTVAYRDDRTRL